MWPKGNGESPSDDSDNSNESDVSTIGWKEKFQELRGDIRARIKTGVEFTNERLEQLETKLDPARQAAHQRYEEASESYLKVKEASVESYLKVKETSEYALDAYRRRDQASMLLVCGIAGLTGSAFLFYKRRWTPASTVALASGGCLYASVYGPDFK